MPALLLVWLCAAELILFLLPGLATCRLVCRKRDLPTTNVFIAAVTISALFGYAAFWIYFANKIAGQAFSYGVVAASIIVLLAGYKSRPRFIRVREFIKPLAYCFCLGLFSLSLLYLFVNPIKAGVDVANVRFFPETRPGDNIVPFIFTERIYDRAPIRPFCCGDWLSSDRPPLQAGVFLLQRPLRVAGNTGLQYQVLATTLQSLWACGVWSLLRSLGASERRVTQALGLLAFSGFLFYNSVYVWPKLFAATFVLFVFAILARAAVEKRLLTASEVMLSSLAFTLAILAHPGSIFSAPALIVLLFVQKRSPRLRHAAIAACICAGLLVPWTLYQKLYDPPGNRLLKMHLAGVTAPDRRGTIKTIVAAYAQLSPSQIAYNKWANLVLLAGRRPLGISGTAARIAQREYVWNAIGLWNLGWIAAAVLHWNRKRRRYPWRYSGVMLCAALLNLTIWCAALFGPGYSVTEHGSYADILLLSLGLIAFLLELPSWVLMSLLALESLNLVFVWILYRPAFFALPNHTVVAPSLQEPMICLAASIGTAGLWHFGRSFLKRESAAPVADPLFEQQTK